jgi:hypothetical protein
LKKQGQGGPIGDIIQARISTKREIATRKMRQEVDGDPLMASIGSNQLSKSCSVVSISDCGRQGVVVSLVMA